VKVYTVMPFDPATRTVPAAPTAFASTVTAPAAGADASADAGVEASADGGGATDAGAWLAVDGDAPVELHPTRSAAVMNSDPTIRAFDRMAQDLAAEMVRRRLGRPTREIRREAGQRFPALPNGHH
jgi:hypothetical protein